MHESGEIKGKTLPNGNKIPPREIFPSPSEFGFNGWYYMSNPESKKMAYEQYQELIHKLDQVIPHDKSSSDEKGTLPLLMKKRRMTLGMICSHEGNTSRGVARKEGVQIQ